MGKRKQMHTYRVYDTRRLHMDVEATSEDEATEKALGTPQTEWVDEGGDIEVECLDDDEG